MRVVLDVGLNDGHRAANHDHIIVQRLDVGREKLMLKPELIHNITDNGRIEITPRKLEQLFIGLPIARHKFRSAQVMS